LSKYIKFVDRERVSKALKNNLTLLPLDSIDHGFKFSALVEKNIVKPKELLIVKGRRAKFLFTLCEELVQRLPQNSKVIEKLR